MSPRFSARARLKDQPHPRAREAAVVPSEARQHNKNGFRRSLYSAQVFQRASLTSPEQHMIIVIVVGSCPKPSQVTLNRSKSVMLARLIFLAFFFAHEDASHFAYKSSACAPPQTARKARRFRGGYSALEKRQHFPTIIVGTASHQCYGISTSPRSPIP